MSRERVAGAAVYLLLLGFLAAPPLAADYPEIQELGPADFLYKQLQADIEGFYRSQSRGFPEGYPPLHIFRYRNINKIDLFSLASRLNIPYDTLATLNRVDTTHAFARLDEVMVPNMPGLFIASVPNSSFEELLRSLYAGTKSPSIRVRIIRDQKDQEALFFPAESFHPVARAFFLQILFRFPVPFGTITSIYGYRPNPFSGHAEFHNGIDIGAPEGTEVFAARDGSVQEKGNHPILGLFVILAHEGGYQTVYGHLSEIKVSLKQKVFSGMIIGRIGNTGRSTGSHLHFEIRREGAAKDPLPLLPKARN